MSLQYKRFQQSILIVKFFVFLIILSLVFPLLAEEDPFLEMEVQVSNDLVFRGSSFNGDLTNERNNRKFQSYTDAWSIIPDLRFRTPIKGLSVFLWGNINLQHYGDRDTDQYLFQNGAGQPDRTQEILSKVTSPGFGFDPNQVKRHKEKNGAQRWNSAFMGIDYSWDTKLGGLTYGTWLWSTANPEDKSIWQEWFFRYRPPILDYLNPEFGFFINTSTNSQTNSAQLQENTTGQKYFSFELGHTFFNGNFFQIEWEGHTGYLMHNDNKNRLSGVSNITNTLRFVFGDIFLGGSWIYRPEVDLFDRYDSNPKDGRISDPSKLYGIENQFIQNQILSLIANDPNFSNLVYERITSQSVIRNLFTINLGYRTVF